MILNDVQKQYFSKKKKRFPFNKSNIVYRLKQ